MHRSSILWLLSLAMGSACTVKTTEPTVRDHRTAREEPPPPAEPPQPEVRDHRTPREEPPPPPPPVVRDHREPPPPAEPSWDSSGWTLLGEQWVEGRRDHDTFRVGPRKGRFVRMTLVVEGSDLQMQECVITYEDGKKHRPKLESYFREGQRTRAIDLEGTARVIKQVDIKYGNLPGGGRAKVQIWGRPERAVAGPPPGHEPPPGHQPPPSTGWDSSGWDLLGEQMVEGRRDRDTIRVGRKEGGFTKLMLVVESGDLQLDDLVIVYANGKKHTPKVKQLFREGQRTRAIDLEGKAPAIQRIELKYGNIPGGGRAKVQVWGYRG